MFEKKDPKSNDPLPPSSSTPAGAKSAGSKSRESEKKEAKEGEEGPSYFVKIYKLEEIGSQRTFRVVYGDDYGSVADRISFSGRTLAPDSHVLVLAPGAEEQLQEYLGALPEVTDPEAHAAHEDIDRKAELYMDPRPSPEVDPKIHPEMGEKIREKQAEDRAIRENRDKEEFGAKPTDSKEKKAEEKKAEKAEDEERRSHGGF